MVLSFYLCSMSLKKITLKKGKEASIQRQHRWIFSGAIQTFDQETEIGELVEVYSYEKKFIAKGYTCDGSIAVKILSFSQEEIDETWFFQKLQAALQVRDSAGLIKNNKTNSYRLIFGEGDGIPGLIADYYNGNIVLQVHTEGIYRLLPLIQTALNKLFTDVQNIYVKIPEKIAVTESDIQQKWLVGKEENCIIQENEIQFYVNWVKGQKTGFFLDQRENRKLLSSFSNGKNVLNTFCYTGGFSIYALKGGAKTVTSVDYSQWAIQQLEENLKLNSDLNTDHHKSITGDALQYLTEMDNHYDVIVLDPPAFAKSMNARHKAIQAYRRINRLAIEKIKPNGVLFTFSCSQVVDKMMFTKAVLSAAIDAGRNVRIMHQLSQPPDHPVSIFHPESEYLKGLVLFIE